jgi:ketosteroid isomerase-like protein
MTDAFNARDLDRIADWLADDVAFHGPGGIRGEGKTACVAFYRGLFDVFPDARLEVHEIHTAGGVTVEDGTLTGTHTGVARTGRSVALDYVQVLQNRDGKQVWLKLMLDRLAMLEQLGLVADAGQAL